MVFLRLSLILLRLRRSTAVPTLALSKSGSRVGTTSPLSACSALCHKLPSYAITAFIIIRLYRIVKIISGLCIVLVDDGLPYRTACARDGRMECLTFFAQVEILRDKRLEQIQQLCIGDAALEQLGKCPGGLRLRCGRSSRGRRRSRVPAASARGTENITELCKKSQCLFFPTAQWRPKAKILTQRKVIGTPRMAASR